MDYDFIVSVLRAHFVEEENPRCKEIVKARKDILENYRIHKSEMSFSEADHLAKREWLEEYCKTFLCPSQKL